MVSQPSIGILHRPKAFSVCPQYPLAVCNDVVVKINLSFRSRENANKIQSDSFFAFRHISISDGGLDNPIVDAAGATINASAATGGRGE
jgi:hypothetical protein